MDQNDIEFALRFTVWSATLATAIIAGHWCYYHPHYRLVTFAIVLKALGWSVHQGYWLQSWIAYSSGDMARHAWIAGYRWIVYGSEIVIVSATVLLLAPYLEHRFGRRWLLGGAFAIAALLTTGYFIGHPQ